MWDKCNFLTLTALCTLGSAEACTGENAGFKGKGEGSVLSVALKSEGDHTVEQLGVLYAERLPKIEGKRAGDGVDLVKEDLARGGIEKKVDT